MCWISARIRRLAVRTMEGYKEITAHHKQLQQQMSKILLNIASNEKEAVHQEIQPVVSSFLKNCQVSYYKIK